MTFKKIITPYRHSFYISVLQKLNRVLKKSINYKKDLNYSNKSFLLKDFYYALLPLRRRISLVKYLRNNSSVKAVFKKDKKYFLSNKRHYVHLKVKTSTKKKFSNRLKLIKKKYIFLTKRKGVISINFAKKQPAVKYNVENLKVKKLNNPEFKSKKEVKKNVFKLNNQKFKSKKVEEDYVSKSNNQKFKSKKEVKKSVFKLNDQKFKSKKVAEDNNKQTKYKYRKKFWFKKYFRGYRYKARLRRFYSRLFLFWFIALYSLYLLCSLKIKFNIWLTFLGDGLPLYNCLFLKIYTFYDQKNYSFNELFNNSNNAASYFAFLYRARNFDKGRSLKRIEFKNRSKFLLILCSFSKRQSRFFFWFVKKQYRRFYVHLTKALLTKNLARIAKLAGSIKKLAFFNKVFRNFFIKNKEKYMFKKTIKKVLPKLESQGFSLVDNVSHAASVYKFLTNKWKFTYKKVDSKYERATFVPSFKYPYPFKRKMINSPFSSIYKRKRIVF